MSTPRPFVFGKLPTYGDFVHRGLSGPEVEAWDAWAARNLAVARDTLGDGFDVGHQNAPPWRFLLETSAETGGWRAGACAPSIDSVGRRFVVVVGAEDLTPADASTRGVRLAGEAEDAIYRAFQDGWDAEALHGWFDPTTDAEAQTDLADPDSRWWVQDAEGVEIERLAAQDDHEVLLRMLQVGMGISGS